MSQTIRIAMPIVATRTAPTGGRGDAGRIDAGCGVG